jgi:hypothetical protein
MDRRFKLLDGGLSHVAAPVISRWRRVVDRLWWLPLLPIVWLIGMELGGYVLLAALLVWAAVRGYEVIFPKRSDAPARPSVRLAAVDESSPPPSS